MKKEKFILILSILVAILFLVSCADKSEETTTPTVDTTDTTDTITTDTTDTDTTTDTSQGDFDESNARTDENGCYDSEGGTFFEKKGYIIDIRGDRFEDECISASSLKEVKCGMAGYVDSLSESCRYGCVDSACVDGEDSPLNCIDSDYRDYYTKGYVNYNNERFDDTCDKNTLTERLCSIIDLPTQEEKYCQYGCSDGHCIEFTIVQETNCFDSDIGAGEEFTKGYVEDPKGKIEDECLNSKTVKEYRCSSIGYRKDVNIECESLSCVDGACIE